MGNSCACCKRNDAKKKVDKSWPPLLINDPHANAHHGIPTNYISTTKYTWWNFLFKNIVLEQFRFVILNQLAVARPFVKKTVRAAAPHAICVL